MTTETTSEQPELKVHGVFTLMVDTTPKRLGIVSYIDQKRLTTQLDLSIETRHPCEAVLSNNLSEDDDDVVFRTFSRQAPDKRWCWESSKATHIVVPPDLRAWHRDYREKISKVHDHGLECDSMVWEALELISAPDETIIVESHESITVNDRIYTLYRFDKTGIFFLVRQIIGAEHESLLYLTLEANHDLSLELIFAREMLTDVHVPINTIVMI
mgnify:CR=1 FL=1